MIECTLTFIAGGALAWWILADHVRRIHTEHDYELQCMGQKTREQEARLADAAVELEHEAKQYAELWRSERYRIDKVKEAIDALEDAISLLSEVAYPPLKGAAEEHDDKQQNHPEAAPQVPSLRPLPPPPLGPASATTVSSGTVASAAPEQTVIRVPYEQFVSPGLPPLPQPGVTYPDSRYAQ